MAWRKLSTRVESFSVTTAGAAPPLAETGACVRETVRLLRASGLTAGAAMTEAARRLGLTERRVRAYQYGEVGSVLAHEYLQIRSQFKEYLAREERRLRTQAGLLAARRLAMGDPTRDDTP